MPFKKGETSNPTGRPRGAKNKVPKDLVERVLQISADLDEQGKGLQHCAEKDPKWFFENFLKRIIPKNFSLAGTEPTAIEVTFIETAKSL